MKPYLVTTGTLFGLFALVHFWRAVVQWPLRAADPWHFLGIIVIGVATAALCVWAWRLLQGSRSGA